MKNFLSRFTSCCGLLLFALALNSCASTGRYQDKTADVQHYFAQQNFQAASDALDKNKFLKAKRNRLLYLLEKGKLEHMLGNYEASNRFLEEAYIMLDDRVRTNVGQAAAAKLTNPMAEPYKGEDFEKVTLHYYKALNFFQLGDPNAALVEARRINILLNQFNEKYKENKNRYARDAFSQNLQGILYESIGDINNAFIAYRNSYEIYESNGGSYFEVPAPEQLKKDLMRTAKAMGFMEEYQFYKKKFPEILEDNYHPAEAIIFWENGLGPQKDQTILSASTVGNTFIATYDDGENDLVIPISSNADIGINALAIPRYRQRQSYYRGAGIVLPQGGEKPLELSQSFFPIARQSLRDRMLRETLDMILRLGAKRGTSKLLGSLVKEISGDDSAGKATETILGAAGAIVEKADTRNWQSLPATISYVRVPLQEGDNTFQIKRYGNNVDYDTITIPYRKGLQIVNYYDIGRATASYVRIASDAKEKQSKK